MKSEWDSFVAKAKNATFLFYRDFMDYHQHRFEDHSLLVFKDDQLFALLPAHREKSMLISHKGLTYGGFVLLPSAKLFDTAKAFQQLISYLNNKGIHSLEIRTIPRLYHQIPSDELEYFSFKLKAELKKRDVIMAIDLEHELGFQKNRREGINKAHRHGLTVKKEKDLAGFWDQILIPNLKNKYAESPVHSLEEIEKLAQRFPDRIQQVNVYKGETLVAGTTVFLTDTTIHPQYVSANSEKNKFGSLDLLYDFVIKEYRSGRRYFDFHTSSEEGGKKLNSGLLFWKESCGARTFSFDTYVIDTSKYALLTLETL